jgi:hypothetical protein
VLAHHNITLPQSLPGKILMAPSFLANDHAIVFIVTAALSLLVLMVLRSNYISHIIFFWICFNLYTVNLPFTDGADVVFFVLALWNTPISLRPSFPGPVGKLIQHTIFNSFRFLCQLQVVLIYFISGFDKIKSAAWRSGEAFDYVRHIDALYNPVFPDILQNRFWDVTFSWMTMGFELLFVLVWFRPLRVPILITGVLFHLGIWIVMSLPDFALVMMVSYLVFLTDKDYTFLKMKVKRWLP